MAGMEEQVFLLQEEMQKIMIRIRAMEEERENKLNHKKTRTVLEQLEEEIPLGGLSEAVKSKRKPLAIFWTIVFLFMLGLSIFYTYKTLSEWFDDPTATKIKLKRQSNYSYPPFVVCVDTWLNATKVKELGLSEAGIGYALSYLAVPYEISSISSLFTYPREDPLNQTERQIGKKEFEEIYKRNFTSLMDFFKYIALDATDDDPNGFGIDCNRCSESSTYEKVIVDHNVCYKIQPEAESISSHTSGWVTVTIRVPDLSDGIINQKPYWKLYVSSQITRLVAQEPFVSVMYDHTHTITVHSEHSQVLNTNHEPCIEKDDPDRPNYSASDCILNCIGLYTKADRNCTLFNLDDKYNRDLNEYCNIGNTVSWVEEWWESAWHKEDIRSTFDQCLETCLPQCEVWRYRTEVDVHHSRRVKMESTQSNLSTAKLLFVNGDVMAGGMWTMTEIDTYSFDTLVGNIGGVWGLWTGASILTLIQLSACCSKFFVICGKRHVRPRLRSKRRHEAGGMLC